MKNKIIKKIIKETFKNLEDNQLLEQTNSEDFNIWAVNVETNECTEISINGNHICENDQAGNVGIVSIGGNNNVPQIFFSYQGFACLPYIDGSAPLNNFENFQNWAQGNFTPNDENIDTPNFNTLFDENSGENGYYLTNTCPSCVTAEFTTTYGIDDLTFIGGDNFALANGGYDGTLSFELNDSCIVNGCDKPYFDNYFCNSYQALCGGDTQSQIGGNVSTVGSPTKVVVEDDDSCEYTGCLEVPAHSQYVCNLYNGALCQMSTEGEALLSGDGILLSNATYNQNGSINGTVTFNVGGNDFAINSDCIPNPGCTNPNFAGVNGNFSNAVNIDDGSCEWYGCANPLLSYLENHVSNIVPSLGWNIDDDDVVSYNDDYINGFTNSNSTTSYTNENPFDETNGTTCPLIEGCTNELYSNYDPDANYDNGTCEYLGCLDGTLGDNGYENANYICAETPTLCLNDVIIDQYETIQGTSEQATYNISDTGCTPFACTDNGDKDQIWWEEQGYADEYDIDYPGVAASNVVIGEGVVDPSDESMPCDYDGNNNGVYNWNEILGCTNDTADNYDETATTNDDSCIFPILGCMDDGEQNQTWWEDNGYSGQSVGIPYDYPGIEADNYESTATLDDGTCTYNEGAGFVIIGCTDNTVASFNPTATIDDEEDNYCEYLEGCTDLTASEINYNPNAVWDDGSCVYDQEGCFANISILPEGVSIENSLGDAVDYPHFLLLMDTSVIPVIYNGGYNWINDGSCEIEFCNNLDASNYNSEIDAYLSLNFPEGYVEVNNCDFTNQCNNPDAWNYICGTGEGALDNGYTGSPEICDFSSPTQPTVLDIYPVNDSTSTENCFFEDEVIVGCMDPWANNYNQNATEDNANVSGNTLCGYNICLLIGNEYAGWPDPFNAGEIFPNITAPFEINATFVGPNDIAGLITSIGDGENKPSYQITYSDGTEANYGGGNWQSDVDNANSTSCIFEGCGGNSTQLLALNGLGMPNTLEDGTSIISEFPSTEIGVNSGLSGEGASVPLYYYNENNTGCPDGSGIPQSDNFSCCYIVGCLDELAENDATSVTVNDESYCEYVEGCTDEDADNFNSLATMDNGLCVHYGCSDQNADNYICNDDGLLTNDTGYQGGQYPNPDACEGQNYPNDLVLQINENNLTNPCIFFGCADPNAENPLEIAVSDGTVIDNGTCTYPIEVCGDSTADNYYCNELWPTTSAWNTAQDFYGIGTFAPIGDEFADLTISNEYSPWLNNEYMVDGWTYSACSIDNLIPDLTITVNSNDELCVFLGCTDQTFDNYDSVATLDDGSCAMTPVVPEPCINVTAYQCNPEIPDFEGNYANYEPGTFSNPLPIICLHIDDETPAVGDQFEYPGFEYTLNGCTDDTACNYFEYANFDSGACVYNTEPCDYCSDNSAGPIEYGGIGYVINGDLNNDGICDSDAVLGCTDPDAPNYNSNANIENGSCSYMGCTDPFAPNYDSNADEDDGSCQPYCICCEETGGDMLTAPQFNSNWTGIKGGYCYASNNPEGNCEYYINEWEYCGNYISGGLPILPSTISDFGNTGTCFNPTDPLQEISQSPLANYDIINGFIAECGRDESANTLLQFPYSNLSGTSTNTTGGPLNESLKDKIKRIIKEQKVRPLSKKPDRYVDPDPGPDKIPDKNIYTQIDPFAGLTRTKTPGVWVVKEITSVINDPEIADIDNRNSASCIKPPGKAPLKNKQF